MNYIDTETLMDGKVRIAYLNRPESFNSLNSKTLTELQHFVESCSSDENVRCTVISARGNAFCSGQNLKEILSEDFRNDEKIIKKTVENYYNPLVEAICGSEKPVISLVNGAAVGAGAMLALICDLCFAAESAYFSMAFSNIGLIPDTAGTYWLPKLLDRQQANYLAFTGKKISASEAKNVGLIADVFTDEKFPEETEKILKIIANQPTKALGLTKKAFNASYENSLSQQLQLEADLQQTAAETADFAEGVKAFVEKRKPVYKGK